MKITHFIFAVTLSLCASAAALAQTAVTTQELAQSNPLPQSAKVKGVITRVDTGFGSKQAYVVTLDKVLVCELTWQKTGDSYTIEKNGDTLSFLEKIPGMKITTPPKVVKTLAVGASLVVQGNLVRKPNGTVVLKGIASLGTGI